MMMKAMKITGLLTAALLLLSLGGCAGGGEPAPKDNAVAISFVDDEGELIELDKPAERIISFYSAHTENLFSLDAQERLIGGHTTCVYPAEAAVYASYDYKGDPEIIIAAEPDVVLIRPHISRSTPEVIAALKNAGICVVSLYPESMEKFPEYIRKLSMLTGTEERAEELLTEFDANLAAIHELTAEISEKHTVFFETTEENIRTAAGGSMPALAVEYAGGINIAEGATPMTEGSSIAEFGAERVLELGDNIDVYVSQRGAMNSGGSLEAIAQRPGFETIKAVREGKVFVINEKLISSPTFRFYKGVHELARFLYPELMDDTSGFESDAPATRADLAGILVRSLHIPIYVPSSSKYYQTERDTHSYGLFEDVHWNDADYDYIETAVNSGCISWRRGEDGKEYFDGGEYVTREELAKTLFIAGSFSAAEVNTPISDLDECENTRIVQILVDNGVFELFDGKFEPQRVLSCKEILNALSFIG